MGNWWLPTGIDAADCVCAYKAEGAASLAASYVNLNNPGTQDAIATVPPTWNATDGWVFNGVDQYLDTGADPASTWTAVCKFKTLGTWGEPEKTGGCLFGVRNSSGEPATQFVVTVASVVNQIQYSLGNSGVIQIDGIPRNNGIVTISGLQGYWNGVVDGDSGSGSFENSGTALTLLLGCSNEAAYSGAYYNLYCNIQSFILYNKTLTAAQVVEVTDNIQAGYIVMVIGTAVSSNASLYGAGFRVFLTRRKRNA